MLRDDDCASEAPWPTSAWTFFSKIVLGGQDFRTLRGLNIAPISSSIGALIWRLPFHSGLLNSYEEVALIRS